MKVSIEISEMMVLKALALSGSSDADAEKILAAARDVETIDITDISREIQELNDLPLAIAFAAAAEITKRIDL